MEWFDLHPKPATAVRQRSALGGLVTISTVLIWLLLALLLARIDLFEEHQAITINTIAASSNKLLVEFDITFFQVSACAKLNIQVVDALGRTVKEDTSKIHSAILNAMSKECRVSGTLEIPAGKGTFRITPQHAFGQRTATFGNTHQINALHIGPSNSSSGARGGGVLRTKKDDSHSTMPGFWTYFLNLVPTWENGQHFHQAAATRSFHEERMNIFTPSDLIGSIYVVYEESAMQMHIESRPTLGTVAHFAARVVGVSGGLFSIIAALREILGKLHGGGRGLVL